ncbi:MAG: hypothetical protein N3F03_03395 [Ignavibacteria bacterium]|nr:hypothetical protein [Ignavibacteria bacterium]
MNTGQTLLVTVGLLLFTIFILTVYRSTTSRFALAVANEALLTGSAIAQSLIDEITIKDFDEKSIGNVISTPDSLTPVNLLGPDLGENDYTKYDDIDDYNGYQRSENLSRLGNFISSVRVFYVNVNNPDITSNTRTFAKRIEVFVRNNFITDTIKMYRVVTY